MSAPDLDAIQARLDAATPGPWIAHEMGGKIWVGNQADGRRHGLWEIVYATDDLTDYTAEAAARYRSDAELIAHAPADLAALLAKVKRLTAERDEARTALAALRSDMGDLLLDWSPALPIRFNNEAAAVLANHPTTKEADHG